MLMFLLMGKHEAVVSNTIPLHLVEPLPRAGAGLAPQKHVTLCLGASPVSPIIYCHLIRQTEKLAPVGIEKSQPPAGVGVLEAHPALKQVQKTFTAEAGDTERRPSASNELRTSARPHEQQISSHFEG